MQPYHVMDTSLDMKQLAQHLSHVCAERRRELSADPTGGWIALVCAGLKEREYVTDSSCVSAPPSDSVGSH